MKKIVVLLLASSLIGFSQEKNISFKDTTTNKILKHFNLTVGLSDDNPVIRLENKFDINENNEIGFGMGYEGFTQNIYEIKVPFIKNAEDEMTDIFKDILKSSVLGHFTSGGNSTLQSLGKNIMGIIARERPEKFKRVLRGFYNKILATKGSFLASFYTTLYQQAVAGKVLFNINAIKQVEPITNDELEDYIETQEDISAKINALAPTVRNPLNEELTKKIDAITFDDIVSSFEKFVKLQVEKDKSQNPTLNIPEFKTKLTDLNLMNILSFDKKPYLYVYDKFFKYDINDKSKRPIIFGGIHDFLEVLIKDKISPDIYILPLDYGIMDRINDSNPRGNDLVIKSDGTLLGTNNVFYLSKISFGGVNGRLKRTVSALKKVDLSSVAKDIEVSISKVSSHNISTYMYAKQKIGNKNVRPYFREEIGLMTHVNNPMTKLSVFSGLAFGVDFNNKMSFDMKGSFYAPIVGDYKFIDGIIRIPQFFKFSLNAVFNLGQ